MNTENMYPKEGNPALRVSSHQAQNQQARPWKCSTKQFPTKNIELEHFLKSWNILSTLFRKKIKAI